MTHPNFHSQSIIQPRNDNVVIGLGDNCRGNRPKLDLLALGECMVELSCEAGLADSPVMHRAYGGDVLNALVTASRLGARTGFITRVGADPFGEALLSAWQEEGIDTRHAPLVPGENGVYFVARLANGEREFSYRRLGSAASQLAPQHLDHAYLRSTRILLLSGITQALSPEAQDATQAAAHIARKAGVMVAYDPNYRPALWARRGGLTAARCAFDHLLPEVDWLLPSFPADAPLVDCPPDSHHATVLHAFAERARWIGLKSGASGSYLALQGQHIAIAPVPVTAVVDSTGAGDAWNGCFLLSLARGMPPADAAARANQHAASTLAFHGAIAPHSSHITKET